LLAETKTNDNFAFLNMPYIKIDETTVPAAGKRIPKQENCLFLPADRTVLQESRNNVARTR
jgi:uncharacterized membrane protein